MRKLLVVASLFILVGCEDSQWAKDIESKAMEKAHIALERERLAFEKHKFDKRAELCEKFLATGKPTGCNLGGK